MKTIEKNYPNLLKLKKEMSIIEDASRVVLIESREGKDPKTKEAKTLFEGVYPEMDEIKVSISELEAPLQAYEELKLENDQFPRIIKEFKEKGIKIIQELDDHKELMNKSIDELCVDFTLDSAKIRAAPGPFFKIIQNFLEDAEKAYQENKKVEADEKERLRLEHQKALKDQKRKEREQRLKDEQSKENQDDDRGILVSLESELKSGKAYIQVE
jgi:hypothetical protein